MPHFEIHANDIARAKEFYTGLFGWSFTPMPGGEQVEYNLIDGATVGTGKALTAGMLKRMGDAPATGAPVRGGTLTVEVENCDQSYDWALNNGGSEALPPMDYPGFGRVAYVEDGQGNIVGMVQPAGGVNQDGN